MSISNNLITEKLAYDNFRNNQSASSELVANSFFEIYKTVWICEI